MNIDFGKMVTAEHDVLKAKKETTAKIADRRYKAEISGIVVDGLEINTERDSQSMITGAALSAFIDPSYVCRWKTSSGFVDLDSKSLIAVSVAMRKHVQACFDREDELLKELERGSFTELMLEIGWPV